ncbi:hypothetical protein ACFFX1_46105 [Dactylosporangium sucinum]|uniref:hypothetical protein n=1 Tax=Dactylosporangium sucinum TaxID=1424081 RepID=UPI00167DCCC2|nr:hypothetical protein [Dactylosporangium sucinum]
MTHGGVPSVAAVAALVEGPPPRQRSPWWWQAFTWLVVVATVAHMAMLVVQIVALRRESELVARYPDDADALDGADADAVFELVYELGDGLRTGLWAYLIVLILWIGTIGRVAGRLGHDRRVILRHWTYLAWRVALVPLLVFVLIDTRHDLPDPADRAAFAAAVLGANNTSVAFAAFRIAALGLLLAYVLVVWHRLRGPERVGLSRGASTTR